MSRERTASGPDSSRETVRESPVTFKSADGAVTLAGTLAVPPAGRAAPAVVLVPGGGPLDRDITILGHKLFRVLAHGLARAGIASLRYDKRGVGTSEGDFSSAAPGDFVADVAGAARHLAGGEGFGAHRVGLIGHSEGGMVALTAASSMQPAPLCVLLATPLMSGVDNIARALALLARGSFQRDAGHDEYVSDLETLIRLARAGGAPEEDPRARELADRLAPRVINDRTAVILGSRGMKGPEFLRLLGSSCLETILSWNPDRVAPLLTSPVLIVYASMDVQVPARENLAAAQALAGRLGKSRWRILEMAGMNHAFQRCATGMPDEYASIDHVMAGEMVEKVAGWIHAVAGPRVDPGGVGEPEEPASGR